MKGAFFSLAIIFYFLTISELLSLYETYTDKYDGKIITVKKDCEDTSPPKCEFWFKIRGEHIYTVGARKHGIPKDLKIGTFIEKEKFSCYLNVKGQYNVKLIKLNFLVFFVAIATFFLVMSKRLRAQV